MTYVAMDKYLKHDGKLAFVITGSVYKTSGAAQGFRTFKLPGGIPLRVIHVDDMNELQPFEGATNRTSVVIIQKGQPTRYPVSYTYWRKAILGIGVDYDSDLEEVFSIVRQMHFQAIPVSVDDRTSPWLTARPGALKAIQKALGTSEYEAHAGVYTGGANGVFWVEVLAKRPDGLLVVRNITEGAKREVESITAEIEPDLVYPLLRGRDVKRWQVNSKSHIIVSRSHSMKEKTFSESDMQSLFPNTYKYLKHFEPDLRKRRDSILSRAMRQGIPYYAISIADIHFAPYKVIWRYIATELTCAVVMPVNEPIVGMKTKIPDHRLMIFSCHSPEEAYYLMAVLNSSISRLIVQMYVVGTQISTHVVQHVAVPKYAEGNGIHKRLATLGYTAANADQETLSGLESDIDFAAAELWTINQKELEEIKSNLAELRGVPKKADEEDENA
jgi:hypothetical protein